MCSTRLLLSLIVTTVTLVSSQAWGQVSYTKEDLATVRVLAVSGVTEAKVKPTQGPRKGHVLRFAEVKAGHGSGVIVTQDGIVLTAQHVIEDAEFIAVRVPERKGAFMAEVIYENELHDVAFLKIAGSFESTVPILDENPGLATRQSVFALGYPLDGTREYPQATAGVVSGTMKSGELQLGISVNPGNSGGPLITQDGRLAGVVVRTSDSSKGIQGIGIAVPYDVVKRYYDARVVGSSRLQRIKRNEASQKTASGAAEVVAQLAARSSETVFKSIEKTDGGFRAGLKKGLKSHKNDADFVALAAAHYWNTAVVLMVLGGEESKAKNASKRARILAKHASKVDSTVLSRSPFLYAPQGLRAPRRTQAEFSVPRRLGGFSLGWSVERAREACEIEAFDFKKTGDAYVCSAVPSAPSLTGPVSLSFCGDKVCKIDVLHRPSKALSTLWTNELDRLRKNLQKRYGKIDTRKVVVPTECRKKVLDCLKSGRTFMRYVWEHPQSNMQLTMGRLNKKPTIRVRLEAGALAP